MPPSFSFLAASWIDDHRATKSSALQAIQILSRMRESSGVLRFLYRGRHYGEEEGNSVTHHRSQITEILRDWGRGNEEALERLIPLVYDELHRRARQLFWRERPGHTLQATALVNEAYLRLADENTTGWRNRTHFFRTATRAMRQILVDHARKRLTAKRGKGRPHENLNNHPELAQQRESALVNLSDALERLRRLDPRQSDIVELRFFGGLTIQETAEVLDCSPTTVNREWRSARIWLRLELKGGRLDES